MDNVYNESRIKSAGETEEIVKDALYNQDDECAYNAVREFLGNDNCFGSPDEFHNLSVNFSRRDDYITACKILEKGLSKYPFSTDLLADYLQIGLFCNKVEECKNFFDILFSIPKMRWTWRGFSFSIDYLQIITDELVDENEILKNKEIMLNIADEYEKYYPYDEDVFLARSEIFNYFNDKEQEIKCLQLAVNKGIKSPKCNLRLADFYFSKGDYKKALEYIDRNKVEGIDVQDRINVGYMYYLSGLCRTALLQLNRDFTNHNAVIMIYQDFYIADETSDNITSYAKNIDRQTFILETKTGIKYQSAIDALFNIGDVMDGGDDNVNLTAKSKKKFPKVGIGKKKCKNDNL